MTIGLEAVTSGSRANVKYAEACKAIGSMRPNVVREVLAPLFSQLAEVAPLVREALGGTRFQLPRGFAGRRGPRAPAGSMRIVPGPLGSSVTLAAP